MQYSWVVLGLVIYLVVATGGCYLHGKQDDVDQIHVIHLQGSEEDNLADSEQEIIEIHIPSDVDRRKREVDSAKMEKSCKTDADCLEGWRCDELLICHPARTSENGLLETSEDTNETENVLEEAPHSTHSVIILNITYGS
ncbi:uncharacterized protein LOC107038632 [Diachasma alloeum]|uniref:uncharacterized protein LOC107038632 n=1 Tax=Diachasma alloeum TaxID=454923 RepID=UPI0010FB87DC|nr:uncharacterized protein LOC107038632 [Diachasma alloeum]